MINASIIIPTCDKPSYLEVVLSNLLLQTKEKDEIIVIDNGTKNSADYLDIPVRTVGTLRYYRKKMEGWTAASAYNLGMEYSCNEMIVIINDDMLPLPNMLKTHKNNYKSDNINLGYILWQNKEGKVEDDQRFKEGNNISEVALERGGGHCSFSITKAEEVKKFDTTFDGGYGYAETDFYRRMKENDMSISLIDSKVIHLWHDRDIGHFPNLSRNKEIFNSRYGN